jgi:hypothetical protein
MSKKQLTDRDIKILEMWNDQQTGGQIADYFGTTRSAILGRLHRLKAYGIDTAKRKPAGVTPQVVTKIEPKVEKAKPSFLRTVTVHYPPKKPVTSGDYLTIKDLISTSCRFIVNDGENGVYLYCGKDKEQGSYCQYHAKMCYTQGVIKNKSKSKEFLIYKNGRLYEPRGR